MGTVNLTWTEEKIALLKQRLDERVDRADIARELGTTPSAINAKIHRLGLAPTVEEAVALRAQASSHYQRVQSRRRPSRPPIDAQSAEAIARIDYERDVVGVEDLLTLEERPEDGCCFPVGDAKEDPRVYCPNTRVPGLGYCEYHAQRMYEASEPLVRRAHAAERQRKKEFENA